MHALTISEKRSYEFEGEWGEAYRTVWKEEREGRNVLIKS